MEYVLSVYFGFWVYLCLLPLIRLICFWGFKNIRVDIHIRPFLPHSYTIVGNHYDLDDDLDFDSSSSSSSYYVGPGGSLGPVGNWTDTLDLRCKVNEKWDIVCDGSGHYHIGIVLTVYDILAEPIFSVDILVPVDAFYRFPIEAAKQYLVDSIDSINSTDSIDYYIDAFVSQDIGHNIRVDGLRDITDLSGCYGLVIKTYWIRIIQRTWKRIYAEKMRLIRLRGGLKAQRNFEISGKYGIGGLAGIGLKRMLICRESANTIVD
jgi:hypothetical protein